MVIVNLDRFLLIYFTRPPPHGFWLSPEKDYCPMQVLPFKQQKIILNSHYRDGPICARSF